MYAMTDKAPDWETLPNFRTAEELAAEAAAQADADNPILAGWDVYGLDTAYQARPPVRELVHGIVSEGSLNIVYGAPGSLKSMLLADMCACIVSGTPWLGHMPDTSVNVQPLRVEQGAVLWIDYDNGRRRSHDRMAALGRAYGLPANAPMFYASMAMPWMNANDRVQLLHLSRLIEKRQIKAMVVDNLGLISGAAEENTADMVDVMRNLRWLADETNCAVTIIHHQRKTAAGDDGSPKAEALRGHGSILGSLDFALHVDRRDGNQVILTPTKTRDAPVFEQAGALFTYEHELDSTIMHTARFFGYAVDGKATREMATIKAAVLDAAGDAPGMNQSELIAATQSRMAGAGRSAGRAKIADAIRQLGEGNELDIRKMEKTREHPRVEFKHYRKRAHFQPSENV